MTVQTTSIVPLIYTGTGSTDTYVYTFTLFSADDLVVEEVTIATGAKQTLTRDAVTDGYEVEVDVNGNFTGNIILSDGNLPATHKIVVYPSYTFDQQTDYKQYGPLPAEDHEAVADKLTLICQQLQEQIDRCLKVSIESGSDPTSDDLMDDINDSVTAAAASEAAAAASETAAAASETAAAASAAAAAASAASNNLPSLSSGDVEKLVQVNATYDGYDLLTKTTLQAEIGAPAGFYGDFGASTAPSGWLLCDGSAVSRTTYAALFAAIGTSYGVGDGSTTFNVPDARGRMRIGLDNLGGSSANRVTAAAADSVGGSGGAETKDISHTHSDTFSIASADIIVGRGSGNVALDDNSGGSDVDAVDPHTHTLNGSVSSGGSATQDVMNPWLAGGVIIKT